MLLADGELEINNSFELIRSKPLEHSSCCPSLYAVIGLDTATSSSGCRLPHFTNHLTWLLLHHKPKAWGWHQPVCYNLKSGHFLQTFCCLTSSGKFQNLALQCVNPLCCVNGTRWWVENERRCHSAEKLSQPQLFQQVFAVFQQI